MYPAGSGEALGWFFLFKPGTQVDEVRITAGDSSSVRTSVIAVYPVQVTGGDQPTAAQGKPEWVTRLNAPVSSGESILFSGFMLGMLAFGVLGFAVPVWGLWRWRGGGRIAAAVPVALMAFVVLRLLIDVSVALSSHNLWPFEILQTGVLSVAIIIAAVVARVFIGANRAS